jgi:hypothetical protein
MELKVLGWARNHGTTEVLDGDLVEARILPAEKRYTGGRPELQFVHARYPRHQIRGIRICGVASLRLGGRYEVQISLRKSEIARLFYLAYRDELEGLLDRIRTVRNGLWETIGSISTGLLQIIGPVRDVENAGNQVDDDPQQAETKPTPYDPMMFKKVVELDVSPRTAACLRNDNIIYIGDLVQKAEGEMLYMPNFGRRSLNEIKEVLAQMGLHLGMELPGWPPNDIENLARRFEESATES